MPNKLLAAILFSVFLSCCGLMPSGTALAAEEKCPCEDSITALEKTYASDAAFKQLVDAAFANMKQLPPEYPQGNPWIGKSFPDLVAFLREWCAFLPEVEGSHDDGLRYIQNFAWFYYKNPCGFVLVQQSPGKELLQDFVKQRGAFLDSPASTTKVAMWLQDPRVEKEDYHLPDPKAPDGGFHSYNEFFARTLLDQDKSRPQTMPNRDYIISAPTDCIVNSIPQIITSEHTPIPTKGNQALNISDLLGGSKYAKKFIGGTALSCVLMPNTYHHYHAPVGGKMVEAKIIPDAFFGYDNFPEWAPPNGNVGYKGSDFSKFEHFQRGYFIIDTEKYGCVAVVPVGLNTVSSLVFDQKFHDLKKPVPVKRGERLGHFLYGGSLCILVFEPKRYASDAIRVRLGNQIGIFDTPAK